MTYPVVVLILADPAAPASCWSSSSRRSSGMFEELGGELPLPTKVLLMLSGVICASSGTCSSSCPIIGWKLFKRGRKSPAIRFQLDRFKLKVPVFGMLFHKVALGPLRPEPRLAAARRRPDPHGPGDHRRHRQQRRDRATRSTTSRTSVQRGREHRRAAVGPCGLPADDRADDRGRRGDRCDRRDAGEDRRLLRRRGGGHHRVADRPAGAGDDRVLGGIVGAMVIALYMPMFKIFDLIQ